MAESKNLKIAQIAKDLNYKNKELTDFIATCGMEAKSTSASLTADEFNLLFDKLTSANQIKNMTDYLSGKADIKRPEKKEEPVKVPEEKKEEKTAEKPAEKPVQEAKPAVKEETKPEVKPEVREEPKPAPKPAFVPKTGKVTSSTYPPRQNGYGQNRFGQQGQQRFTPNGVQRPGQNPARPASAASARPQTPVVRQPKAPKQSQPQNPPKIAQFTQAERGSSKSLDRFQKPNFGGPSDRKPAKQETSKREQERQQSDAPRFVGGGEQVTAVRNTRIVDTRSSSVDLSKYDERLESFVPESARRSNVPDRQKLKKQNNNQFSSKKNNNPKLEKSKQKQAPAKQELHVAIPDEITVGELAQMLKVTAAEVVKRLMMLDVMATVNQVIDYDTAYLVADELGAVVTKQVTVTIEEKLFDDSEDKEEDLITRDPVVCVMGHVDHGKTSLLDAIRHTNVTAGEAGGITQSIGAYRVTINGKNITFLDTPGHEAFTAMRARGAMATDIAVLVVAADDGVMPQTIEAINHAKAAGVEVIVAINKMDKPGANPEIVKQQLTQYDLLPEEWGGKTICVPVSALTKKGIPDLLENILLVAEVAELKANPNRRAKGVVLEASLDKGRGPVATILVQNGTLHQGDVVICGTCVGRIRAMTDDKGKQIKSAGPSVPVVITGLDDVPMAGDEFKCVEDEKMARELAEQRKSKEKDEELRANTRVSLDDFFNHIKEGIKDLNIIVKADVKGSAEAVKASLLKLTNDEVHVNVIHCGVGGITEGDVTFAAASKAIIVGFNVRPDKQAMDMAGEQGVEIRTYRIIYECIDEIEAAIKGMLKPEFKEVILGHAEVRQTIHVSSVGTIAGSYVQDGKVTNKSQIRVIRDGVVIFEDKISSLRRFKDDVKEVAAGYECGIGLEKFNDIKENDILEAFTMEEVAKETPGGQE